MTLALLDPTRDLDPSMSPMALQRLFSGLIEMQDDAHGDPDNPFCRLCHSTLREFLEDNPAILYLDSPSKTHSMPYTITHSVIGDLCLRYLSLDRYHEPLDVTENNLVEASFLLPGELHFSCLGTRSTTPCYPTAPNSGFDTWTTSR